MKKYFAEHTLEKGQVIPLVVVMLFAILGMTALILDGGSVLSNRRTAQAAADAGALAGAKRVCYGNLDGKVVAETYAYNNGATSANATVVGTEVTVNAVVENGSFFAKIFGVETLEASAEATAGCYGGVSDKAVLPMAVECRARALGQEEIPFPEEYDCQMQTLSWDLLEPLLNGEVSFVVIDGVEFYLDGTSIVDSAGKPPGLIYTLGGNDKVLTYDLSAGEVKTWGGDRGWVYLIDQVGNEIKPKNIEEGLDYFNPPAWLKGKSGVTNSLYDDMKKFVGEVVLVPLYDSYNPNGNENYHIVTFQPFYITCIAKNKKPECPGRELAADLGLFDEKDSVIEGFFLSDYLSPDSSQGCDINLGNCTISLSN